MDSGPPTRPSEPEPPSDSSTQRTGFRLVAAELLTIWGLALSNTFLGLVILWSAREFRNLRWNWRQTSPLLVPLGLYVIFMMVSVVDSLDPRVSFTELKSLPSLLTPALILLWVRGEKDVRRLVDWVLIMMVILAIHGIGQYLLTDYGPLHRRIPGMFSHYMTYSGVLLLGEFLVVGRLLAGVGLSSPTAAPDSDTSPTPKPGWQQPWNWVALALITTALLMTLTRGAWVAAAVTLTVALWVRVRRFFAAYVAATLVVGTLFVALAPEAWTSRLRSIADPSDASNYDRLCMAQAGFHMISERPLFGIGPKMVQERYPIYRHPTAPRYTVKHLHNSFLHLAAERGLLSLAAYFWLMGAGLLAALRGFRREGGDRGGRADLYLGVILALVGFNLAGLFEANWRDTEVQRLVFLLLTIPFCLRPSSRVSEPRRPQTR